MFIQSIGRQTIPKRSAATPKADATSLKRKPKSPNTAVGGDWRTLLVPVDFSARSLEALDFAVSIARKVDASIVVLHVIDPIHAPGRLDARRLRSLRAEALRNAKRQLAQLVSRRVKPHVPVTQKLLKGLVYSVIVEAAAKARADLIVMGSEGRTGMSRFLIGSVTEKVIRHARCSVLVVRGKGR
jgi:nucleotide-binding universal stress UspA family protein